MAEDGRRMVLKAKEVKNDRKMMMISMLIKIWFMLSVCGREDIIKWKKVGFSLP